MAAKFLSVMMTPAVLAAQSRYYSRDQASTVEIERDLISEDEADFISQRDSFYFATTNSEGWPYIQHRGGLKGFLQVLGPHLLGFADLKGNRQLLTTGNLDTNPKVSLFLMDYPNRTRLKILGLAHTVDAREDAALADQLCPDASLRQKVERVVLIDVVGFDWNCPQYITPRYTLADVEAAMEPLKARILELEKMR